MVLIETPIIGWIILEYVIQSSLSKSRYTLSIILISEIKEFYSKILQLSNKKNNIFE